MSWVKGFNFRSTDTYVADGADETYVIGDAYPTTRGGVTFGWDGAINKLNRNAAIDRRLAGIHYSATIGRSFRVDLPSPGTYRIRAAVGDAGSVNRTAWLLKDNAITLITFPDATVAGAHWLDATLVDRASAALWVANNVAVQATFASTILNMAIWSSTSNSVLAHLYIEQIGGGVIFPRFRFARRCID